MRKCHWYSKSTGEIVESFSDVVYDFWYCLTRYHFLNWNWKYSRQGW